MARKLYRQIGERIRNLRKLARLTQEQLAERADLSVQFVGFIERGQAKPTLDSLEKLAAALGARVEDIFRFQRGELQEAKEGIRQITRLLKNRDASEINLFRAIIEQTLQTYQPGKHS